MNSKRPALGKMYWLCIILLTFLAACSNENEDLPTETAVNGPSGSGTSATVSASERIVTIRFAVDNYEITQYDDLIQAFQEENRDIRIQLLAVNELLELDPASGAGLPTDTALQLAQSVDVFPARYSAGTALDNIIRDLTPFIQADADFDTNDFYPNALQDVNGRIYTLPTSLNYLLIYYNKDAFDNAGLAYPQPGWTWDDFRSTANTLTLRDGGEVTQWGFAQPFTTHLPFIEGQLQTPLADSRTSPPTFRFSEDDVITAVQWYTTLFLTDEAAPLLSSTEAYSLIQANQVSMWPESTQSLSLSANDSQIGIVPFPANAAASNTTPLFVSGWVMSAGTVNSEAAWKWMTYLSRQQPPDALADSAMLPARASVAEATSFWDQLTSEQSVPLRYAVENSYLAQFGDRDAFRLFNEAVNVVLNEGETVESALMAAQTAAGSLLVESGEGITFTVPDEAVEPEGDIASITFLINSNIDLEAYRILAEEFEINHPDVQIQVRRHSISSFTSLSNAARNADCFQGTSAPADDGSRSVILTLDPFIEADTTFDLGDFYPVLVVQYSSEGQLWGLPAEVQPFLIEYNKDLFDATGVAYPSFDWTMDEFLETAVALTQGDGETRQYGFAADVIEFNLLPLMLERLGADLIDNGVDPPTTALNSSTTVEAMRWYSNLTTEFDLKPVFVADPADIQNVERVLLREQLLNEQRVAMWTPSFYSQVGFLDPAIQETMNIGIAPLPVGAGGGFLPAIGYYISASTAYRDICWEWIKFLSLSSTIGQGVPARRSVAESEAFRQRVSNEWVAASLASINGVTGESIIFRLRVGNESWMLEAIYWLGRAYAKITDGDATVEEALNEAQAIFDAYRACMIANDEFTDIEVRNSCIQEADPLFPTFLLERR